MGASLSERHHKPPRRSIEVERTAIRQKRVSLPEPRLTIWQRVPRFAELCSHWKTRSSIAVARTNVPMLIKGGLGGCRCDLGTRCLMYGSWRYPFCTADSRARAASVSVSRMDESASWVCEENIGWDSGNKTENVEARNFVRRKSCNSHNTTTQRVAKKYCCGRSEITQAGTASV
jgi:hypothetical protein